MSTDVTDARSATPAPDAAGKAGEAPEKGAEKSGEKASKQGKQGNQTASRAKPKTRTEYRPDIDGIRGCAAIMVMGFHGDVPGFKGGYIGLDLFFVVSGYVITGLLLSEHEKTGKIRWGGFYARRARRLIPAKATMLIGVLILSYFIVPPTGQAQETADSAAAAAAFVSNFFFWHHAGSDINYFAHVPGTGVLLHTWSLAVEEQFYIAVPAALLLSWLVAKLLRVPPVRMLLFTTVGLAVASCVLAIAWSTTHPNAAYYMPMTRAFEFLIGVALALMARLVVLAVDLREVMGLVGALLIAYCLVKPMPTDGYPSYWALIPCSAAVLMVWAGVDGPTAITRFLSFRLFVGLGLVSYGWYLWHWPLLVLGESENLAQPPLWARIVLIMVALGIAILSYRYVEGLFYKRSGAVKKSGATWGSRRVVISGVLAMAAVAGLAFGGAALADTKAHSDHWEQVADQLDDHAQMPAACVPDGSAIQDRPGRCDLVPFESGRPTVVLWGDSHAWMFIPALQAAAEKDNTNLVSFVLGACPPFDAAQAAGACAKSNAEALSYVTKLAERPNAPVRVIMSASWETYLDQNPDQLPAAINTAYLRQVSGYFTAGGPTLFDELRKLGIDVDVVGPTAIIPRSAPLCEARAHVYGCDPPRSQAIPNENATLDWLQDQMVGLPRQSRLIDVTPALCSDTTCFAKNDGVVFYIDDNHLSATFAVKLTKFFLPSFRALDDSYSQATDHGTAGRDAARNASKGSGQDSGQGSGQDSGQGSGQA